MLTIDADLAGGLLTLALLLLMAVAAMVAGRRQPAETFSEFITKEF